LYEVALQLEMFSGVGGEGNGKSVTYSEVYMQIEIRVIFPRSVTSVRYLNILQLNCLLNVFAFQHLDFAHLNRQFCCQILYKIHID